MESIIAIIIILGFVISILPDAEQHTGRIPPDLEQTTTSILKEMQDDPPFRDCVLGGGITFDFDNNGVAEDKSSVECVYGYVKFLAHPIEAHPWNYSVTLCKLNQTSEIAGCEYYPSIEDGSLTLDEKNNLFVRTILPMNRDVYTRSLTLGSPDVSGEDPSSEIDVGNYTILTIYAWSKI